MHPIIVAFEQTLEADFPLILAIGREPNNEGLVENCVGLYDFRWSPRCAFWNTAYTVMARTIGSNIRDLKQQCIAQHGSPIILADALPQCIPTRVGNKQQLRAAIPQTTVSAHIGNMFSYKAVLARVRLVLLSGLDSDPFAAARAAIIQQCSDHCLPYKEIPFLYPTNTPKIQQALSGCETAIIRDVFAQFRAA